MLALSNWTLLCRLWKFRFLTRSLFLVVEILEVFTATRTTWETWVIFRCGVTTFDLLSETPNKSHHSLWEIQVSMSSMFSCSPSLLHIVKQHWWPTSESCFTSLVASFPPDLYFEIFPAPVLVSTTPGQRKGNENPGHVQSAGGRTRSVHSSRLGLIDLSRLPVHSFQRNRVTSQHETMSFTIVFLLRAHSW